MEQLHKRQQCKARLAEREGLVHALTTLDGRLRDAREELAELDQIVEPVVAGKRRWWRSGSNDPRLVALANTHNLTIELEEERSRVQTALDELHQVEAELHEAEAACVAEWRMFDPERARAIEEIDADMARLCQQLLHLNESQHGASAAKQSTGWLVGALREAVTGTTLAVAFHPDGSPSDGGTKVAEIEACRRAVVDASARIDDLSIRALASDARPITGTDGTSSIARIADAYDSARILDSALGAYLTSLNTDTAWVIEQLDGCRAQREQLFQLP